MPVRVWCGASCTHCACRGQESNAGQLPRARPACQAPSPRRGPRVAGARDVQCRAVSRCARAIASSCQGLLGAWRGSASTISSTRSGHVCEQSVTESSRGLRGRRLPHHCPPIPHHPGVRHSATAAAPQERRSPLHHVPRCGLREQGTWKLHGWRHESHSAGPHHHVLRPPSREDICTHRVG